MMQGKGYVSTEALTQLSQNNRNVILLDNHGKPVTFCNGMMDSLTGTKVSVWHNMIHFEILKNVNICISKLYEAKKESQLKLLKLICSDDH